MQERERKISWLNDQIQFDELSGQIRLVTKYTADDEEPDCMKCKHCCDDPTICVNKCGADHA